MSAASTLLARRAGKPAAQSTRIADLPVLLAVLAAQQATGFTAKRVREGDSHLIAEDEPARMAEIFAPAAAQIELPRCMAGAFNAAVAERLTMGTDGESDVYSGT